MKRQVKSSVNIRYVIFLVVLLMTMQQAHAAGSNDELKGRIERAITDRYDPSGIRVTVNDNGLVTLRGDVNSLYDKYLIYEISSRVPGVKQIKNNIKVDTDMLPAKIIEADIRWSIDNSTEIKEPQKIDIDVTNSVVKLSGNVNFFSEKTLAMTLASQAEGVTDIEDDITVTPIGKAVDDKDLQEYLNSILLNEFPLTNPKDLSITVDKGFVTLEGAAPDLWTKENIEKEFASVAGVIRVINNLMVNPYLPNS